MLMSAVDSRRLLDVGFPAMVLPIAKDGLLIGAHVTSLTKDATAKLERQAGAVKKTYGPIKGGFVQLGEIDPDGELIVAEGVETTLSAMQLSGKAGVAAISASNMPAVELPDGPDIIVCADADDAGVEAAEKLTKRLAMTGRRVRKAVLDGDPGYDFNDALRAGDDAAAKAIEGAKLIRKPTRVEAITMEEFMELIFPKKEHMLSPWLETSSLAMVHAYRGVAKTWFCLGVARAVARGEDFMDWKCRSAGRVLYVDGEMPGGTLQKRLKALGDIPAGNLHVLSREQFALMQQDMPDLGTEEGREVLDRIIERADPKLIILDSESTLVRTGFENDADSWRPLQAWIMKHRWRGRTLIYVVHDGLSGRARGTTKREDVMDTSIGLKLAKEQTPDETTIELAFDKHRNFFGQDAEPRVLTFRVSDDDVEWEMEMQRDERKERIAQMLHDGWKQKDIAKELGLTEGRVSQIKKEIEADQAPRLKTGENVVPFKGRDDL
ncbi:hypothetical protein LCM4577_15170 [Mesorhizobium sp. LCM 4577]|nr:hypothetical protein LCM4577_15170 [Mesorhizobium sp. LCM 4577]